MVSAKEGFSNMIMQTDASWEIILPHEHINGVIRICFKALHINCRTPKYSDSVCVGVRLIVCVKGNRNSVKRLQHLN